MASTEEVLPMGRQADLPAGDGPEIHLEGHLSTFRLFLIILALAAPLSIMTGFLTVIIGYGNGLGAPIALLTVGALLLLFCVGFLAMGRSIPNPGGLYTYVTAGCGRPLGLSTSLVAIIGFSASSMGGVAFFGLTANSLVVGTFHGPNIDWWIYGIAAWVIVSALTYFNVDLSVKVLGTILLGEFALMIAYNVVVGVQGGAHGYSLMPFTPGAFTSGGVGIALLFSATIISGFEQTTAYREETRDPDRAIPRATYLSVIAIAGGYAITTYMIIIGVGTDRVVGDTAKDPTGTLFSSIHHYLGATAIDLVNVFVVTSILGAMLGCQSIAMRYIYSLGADGILPRKLGEAHPKYKSPHRASLLIALVVIAPVAPFFGSDPTKVYASFIGFTGYALIFLYCLTSVSVIVYFRRTDKSGASIVERLFAPAVSLVGLIVVFVMASRKVDVLGGSALVGRAYMIVLASLMVLGIVIALLIRRTRPEVYSRIGRQVV